MLVSVSLVKKILLNNYGQMQKQKSLMGMIGMYILLVIIMVFGGNILYLLTGNSKMTPVNFLLTRVSFWIVLGLLYLYVKLVEKTDFFLWKDIKYRFFVSLGYFFVLLIASYLGAGLLKFITSLFVHENISAKLGILSKIFKENIPLIFISSITAGVVEEMLFRVYMQTRLQMFFKKPIFPILISSVLFGILHYTYGTLINVFFPIYLGLLFSFFYWKYRNIKIAMWVHFFIDTIAFLIITYKR